MRGLFLRLNRHRAQRDAGAVAVIVALVVSTVLLGFAAFAVDFGNALAQRVDLQGIAAAAARAGAAELPDAGQARQKALLNLCGQPAAQTHWNYAGCGSPLTGPTAADGTATQIAITDDEGRTSGTGFVATRISVTPPPYRVEFSFGQALGVPGVSVGATSKAGIGTPTGYGVLPYFLTPADFKTEDVPDSSPLMSPAESYQRGGSSGRFCISIGRSTSFGAPCPAKQLPAPGSGTVNSEQGELNVPRTDTTSNMIVLNTRRGLQFSLYDWSRWPSAGAPRVPDVGTRAECGAVADARPAAFPNTVQTNCLNVLRAAASGNFTERDGFFGSSSSRANRVCPGGTTTSISSSTSADDTDLFSSTVLDDSKRLAAGIAQDFATTLESGSTVAVKGWIKPSIFRCGRLMLLPVLDAQLPVSNSGSGKSYPILGFAYAWIQDSGMSSRGEDGYLFSGAGRLIGLQGYILPRWYFPDVVYDSPTVGPYLGAGWPKQVVMVE